MIKKHEAGNVLREKRRWQRTVFFVPPQLRHKTGRGRDMQGTEKYRRRAVFIELRQSDFYVSGPRGEKATL